MRELAIDPERSAQWQKGFREQIGPTLDVLRIIAAEAKSIGERPATDEHDGRVVRRLVGYNEYRLDRIEKLLIWWAEVDDGTADEDVRNVVSRAESALDSITILGPEERAQLEARRETETETGQSSKTPDTSAWRRLPAK